MLRELLSVFRGGNEYLTKMGEMFARMMGLAVQNALDAGRAYFGNATPSERSAIYEKDIEINKLERQIRKRVATHLTFAGNEADIPYCLLLMSIVKDVERIGDYAKNLCEVEEIYPNPLPDDANVQELRELRREIEESLTAAADILESSDRERALQHIQAGKNIAHRCDALVIKAAKGDYSAPLATSIVLGARFYKRIGAHVRNILTSVVMPLHKVDYLDEDEIDFDTNQPRVK